MFNNTIALEFYGKPDCILWYHGSNMIRDLSINISHFRHFTSINRSTFLAHNKRGNKLPILLYIQKYIVGCHQQLPVDDIAQIIGMFASSS